MSSAKQPASSGSEVNTTLYADVDERKRKRMISNRDSARRSRMRKQQLVDGLANQVQELQGENEGIEKKVNEVADMYVSIASQNKFLRAQLAELADRLRSLNSVLHVVKDVSGLAVDIPEIPEILMEPWQLPCPASTSIFQC